MARSGRRTLLITGIAQGLGAETAAAFARAGYDMLGLARTDRRFGPAAAGRMDAKSIAQSYLQLAAQDSSAWTQEMDLRPFAEKFQEAFMASDRIHADFNERVVITTDDMPWIPSPQAGVERRMLDRIGGEVARATSLVRYAADSSFPAHVHALGEEFLVLSGVFSDEHGDYPTGTYVRNPPASRHTPRTAPGCVILVKLRQMTPDETERVVIDTAHARWQAGDQPGLTRLPLHAGRDGETVALERLAPGTGLAEMDCPAGEEIFVVSGDLHDEHGCYGQGAWIRNPPDFRRALGSTGGAIYWVKRGHLRGAPTGMP